jgi:hypothetical protein
MTNFIKINTKTYVSRINNKSLEDLLHDKGFADKAASLTFIEPEIPFKT